MKKLIAAIALSSVLATPIAFADDNQSSGMGMGMGMGMGGGMMMNMMSHDDMMAMNEHMQRMQTLMNQIQTEKNTDKRQKLMEQHWQEMQQSMQMMNNGMMWQGRNGQGGHMMGNNMKGGKNSTQPCPQNGKGPHCGMSMEDRLNMMENRIGMMQMMMGQMMDHDEMMQMGPMQRGKK